MAENASSTEGAGGLTLVHLDFHDGSRCKVWLQQDVVKRLQDGDDSLMEELRQQFLSTETSSETTPVKRKSEFHTIDGVKKIKQDDAGGSTIIHLGAETVGDEYAAHNVTTTYYVDPNTNEVSVLEPQQNGQLQGTVTVGAQLVNAATLNNGEQYQGSYLEELTVAEENYIELPPNASFQLQEGTILTENGNSVIIKAERKVNFNNLQRKKRKKGLRRYMKYTVEEREEAVRLIKAGEMSQQEASRKYNIPQGTLSDYVRSGTTRWGCAICKRKYTTRNALEQHHITHYESRPYLCDYCGFTTKDRATLLKHRSKRHSDITEEYIDDNTGTVMSAIPQKQTVWTPESTKEFLKEYEVCLQKLDNDSLKKKYIWHMLADKMCELGHYVNARQASTKWKTMITSYMDFKKGGDRRQFNYFADIEAFIGRNEGKFHSYDDEESQDHERVAWSHASILLLISEYEARLDKFDSTSVKKKVLWKEIHESFKAKGFDYGFGQVQNKWKVLLRNYKTFKSNSAVADGEGIQYFPYYEHLSRLVENRPNQSEEKFDYSILQEESNEIQETEIITQPFVVTPVPVPQSDEVTAEVEMKFSIEQITNPQNNTTENTTETSIEKIEANELLHSETKVKVEWNDESVHLLIQEYESLLSRFRNPMVKKKLLWQKIHSTFSSKGFCMSAGQIENKWRVLSRNYTKACSENVLTNNEVYPYIEEIRKVFDAKDGDNDIKPKQEEDDDYYGIDELSKVWTQSATLDLLHEYELRVDQFEDDGVKKKVLWQEISDALAKKGINVTVAQTENKWKTLLRCYKIKIGCIPSTTVRRTRDFPYLERMNEIIGDRIEIPVDGVMPTKSEPGFWTHDATMLLLKEYGTRLDRFDCEYVKRKEYLWQEVSIVFKDSGYTYTVAQLMNKWKSLLKKYRTIVEIIYSPETPFEKRKRKIECFPYLVEMGQLLGHNHDVEGILSAYSDGQEITGEDSSQKKKGKKAKGKHLLEEPKTYQDVLKYLHEYEDSRENIEQARVKQLSDLYDEKLANLEHVQDMKEHLKEFEVKREILEKQRLEEMAAMHKEKMTVLKSLLRTVKKKQKLILDTAS